MMINQRQEMVFGGGQRFFTAHKRRGLPGTEAGLTPVVEVDLLPRGKVVDQRAWRQTIVNYLNGSQDKTLYYIMCDNELNPVW